jgi:hypothetical protein
VHIYVPGTCGDRRVVLHGILPDGREEIHGTARGAEKIPVRPGDAAGGSLQAAGHLQAERAGAEWHIVPTGGQHYNGQAERLIGLLKRCLEGALNNRRFTLGELSTVVAEAAQVVNSRPIAKNTGDPETGGPITPLHLQLGRATVEVPRMRFEEAPRGRCSAGGC